jgi:hypothetical protein
LTNISSIIKMTQSKKKLTLSDYLPKGTTYFYGFPTGQDSKFYNNVPAYDEELVSARPIICAGEHVKVITFSAAASDYSYWVVSRYIDGTSKDSIVKLPDTISADMVGAERNTNVKDALGKLVDDRSLVMAQPYIDKKLENKFIINPELSAKLSSKNNMELFVPTRFIPKVYHAFSSGAEFNQLADDIPTPCVIKVANSSSGDGVVICYSDDDVESVKEKFKDVTSFILIEQFIESKHNLCVQFGVPYDDSSLPEVIGFNEQITSPQGGFLGGVVNPGKLIGAYDDIKKVILEEILPKLSELGWCGIGGIDVLIQEDGSFFFIDPNLRLTATYAYVYLAETNQVKKPVVSFSGKIQASREEFENNILVFAEGTDPTITIISITEQDGIFRFNAGVQFDSAEDLTSKSQSLLDTGIEATVLNNIVSGKFNYSVF